MTERATTWVVVSPDGGVQWIGLAEGERRAWDIALGWPGYDEIAEHKAAGWYAAEATTTWSKPT